MASSNITRNTCINHTWIHVFTLSPSVGSQIPQVVMNIDIVTPLYQSLTKTSPHAFLRLGLFYAKPSLQKKISIQSRSFHFISGGRHILLNKPFLITSSVDFCRFLKHFRVKIRRPMHGGWWGTVALISCMPHHEDFVCSSCPTVGHYPPSENKISYARVGEGKAGKSGLGINRACFFLFLLLTPDPLPYTHRDLVVGCPCVFSRPLREARCPHG